MDSALCLANGKQYTGPEFAGLNEALRNDLRRQLVCVECRTPAYFRKESKSGQGPCFGARPHTGCVLATPESARGIGAGTEEDILHNPGTHIVIDAAQGAHENVNIDVDGPNGGAARGGRYTGAGGQRNANSRRRLRPLLKNLIYLPAFRTSTQTIEIPERGTWTVRELFVNFSDADTVPLGAFHGFWGEIYDVGTGADGSLWLNAGQREAVSVVVNVTQVNAFLARHSMTVAELEGVHLLVFGTIHRSGNGKLYIRPAAIDLTAVVDD
ncbi:hypothetical protein [Pseudomonas defluvii]|uniref:hypothetical protein n=1 Tax=Pseudomonas defluvii TaxID=1876757 RepID=UPI0039062F32